MWWPLLLVAGITIGEVALGLWIVPARAGGSPYVGTAFSCRCQHAFASWLWPTLAIAALSLGWLGAVSALVIRPLRRAQWADLGRRRPAVAPSDDRSAEGWYHDPYRRHADRWYSSGEPTSLVRDGGLESRDEPPDRVADGPLIPAAGSSGAAPSPDHPAPDRPAPDTGRRRADAGSRAWDAAEGGTTWITPHSGSQPPGS
jgi:hypothetical protein